MPLGEGPFSLEGQVGPGGGGGSLNTVWPIRASEDGRRGLLGFVAAGLGAYFTSASPGRLSGGAYTLIAGLRFVPGGLAFEAGLGAFQTLGPRNPDGKRNGPAGRLAVGWQF